MDEQRSDPFAEVINLLAAPIASGLRGVEQMRRGADEMWRAVENLNRTMETLNETAERVNRLLADIEEPVRAAIPQLTRTIKTADELTQRLDAPIRAAAPNLEKMAETFAAPAFADLPGQIGEALNTLGEMSRRLSPLAAFAENAGGLFGGLRLPGVGGRPAPSGSPTPSTPTAAPDADRTPPAKKSAAKKASATKRAAKKASAKKRAAKRS